MVAGDASPSIRPIALSRSFLIPPHSWLTTIIMYSLLPAIVFSLFSFVSALPLALEAKRDVWTPPVTYPTNTSIWVAGSTYNVTWSTAGQPSEITNPIGQILLRHGVNTTSQINLVEGFNLTAGAVNVTIPADTEPDSDYIIVRELTL